MLHNMPRPGSSHHLTFATNPLLSNFIGKSTFFMEIDTLVLYIHKSNIFLK